MLWVACGPGTSDRPTNGAVGEADRGPRLGGATESEVREVERLAAVRDGCRLVAEAVREAAGVTPQERTDEAAPESTGPRCTVDLEIETDGGVVGPDPADAVRAALAARGWSEDIMAAADGPGTTAFAFTSGSVRCAVSAGQPSWLEDDSVHVSTSYSLRAHCLPED